MVISLLIFGHRGPKLGVVESAGWIVALISPLSGILAIEISQIRRQTARLQRVQVVLNLFTALGTCATSVMLVLSFMALHSELQSAEQGSADGEHTLMFWMWLAVLGAFAGGFTCASSLIYAVVSQRESGGSYGREATLLLRHIETSDACGGGGNTGEGSVGESEEHDILRMQGSGQGGYALAHSEGDSSTVVGVSERRAAYKKASRMRQEQAQAQVQEEGENQQESGGHKFKEARAWVCDLAGMIDFEQSLSSLSKSSHVDFIMGRADDGSEGEEKRVGWETHSGMRHDGETSMTKDKVDACQGSETEWEGAAGMTHDDGKISITERKVEESQRHETDGEGQRMRRRRICKGILVFMLVCISCVLALHLAWRRRDGHGESMRVMRRCNGAEYLCQISYDKVCDVLIFQDALKYLKAVLTLHIQGRVWDCAQCIFERG